MKWCPYNLSEMNHCHSVVDIARQSKFRNTSLDPDSCDAIHKTLTFYVEVQKILIEYLLSSKLVALVTDTYIQWKFTTGFLE